jgi:hypothetical protein
LAEEGGGAERQQRHTSALKRVAKSKEAEEHDGGVRLTAKLTNEYKFDLGKTKSMNLPKTEKHLARSGMLENILIPYITVLSIY